MARRHKTRRAKPLEQILGDRIRALREEQALTRARLAEEAHVSLTALHLCETARTLPSLKTLQAVSGVLGVRIADLLDDEPQAARPTSGTTTFFRLVGRLRDRDDNYLRAVEKLVKALDQAAESVAD